MEEVKRVNDNDLIEIYSPRKMEKICIRYKDLLKQIMEDIKVIDFSNR